MERAGLRVVAVVVNASTFGGEEEMSLASQLASTGTMTYVIERNDALEQALSRQRMN
jgi:hypothetical protein